MGLLDSFYIENPSNIRVARIRLSGYTASDNIGDGPVEDSGRMGGKLPGYMGGLKAFRAVAIAVNPIGYLIPFHREISKSGDIHGYRWGAARKKS